MLRRPILVLLLTLSSIACENARFRAREAGALAGGALGAGLGAIVGNQVGNPGAGVAIGAAAGAIGGGLIGHSVDQQQDDIDRDNERLAQNERTIEENRRLLEELRARGIDVRTTNRGVVANLPDVLFQFGKSSLTSSARRAVSDIARVIKSAPNRRVAVEGHTDSVGSVAYNEHLSRDRARAVADSLVESGVNGRRISTHGFGESRPIASNASDEGRRRNRRVEVIIENDR